jgi:hypothetical protein
MQIDKNELDTEWWGRPDKNISNKSMDLYAVNCWWTALQSDGSMSFTMQMTGIVVDHTQKCLEDLGFK